MQPSMIVEPKRINTDDPLPAPVAIFLLMVHHPELAVPIFCYAAVPRPKDVAALSDQGIIRILDKGAERYFSHRIADGVVRPARSVG